MNIQLVGALITVFVLVALCLLLVRVYLSIAGVVVPLLVRFLCALVIFIILVR